MYSDFNAKTAEEFRLERYKEFGKRLKTARKNKHLTQEELGNRIGVSGTTVSSIETGAYAPSFWTVAAIAECIGVTVDSLVAPCPDKQKGHY